MSKDSQINSNEHIIQTLKTIKFGSLEIVIHEGKIVQIEKREKIRFDKQ